MQLRGWKYEGRKISDKLHEQMLVIVDILNDSSKVGNKNWPELQTYIARELGITTGQVRTIKRMMEELDIVKKGALNAGSIPDASVIYTDNGKTFVELMAAERLMKQKPDSDNLKTMREIKNIYRLYYQKVLSAYTYSQNGSILHPLKATLKAVKKYEYLDYWEWYLLNTIIQKDDDVAEEAQLDKYIMSYRQGSLKFREADIVENQLSHSYVLGNYVYAGLVCVKGNKPKLRITLNPEAHEIINEILLI